MAVLLIDKIMPKNDAFIGLVDAEQVIGLSGYISSGWISGSGTTFDIGPFSGYITSGLFTTSGYLQGQINDLNTVTGVINVEFRLASGTLQSGYLASDNILSGYLQPQILDLQTSSGDIKTIISNTSGYLQSEILLLNTATGIINTEFRNASGTLRNDINNLQTSSGYLNNQVINLNTSSGYLNQQVTALNLSSGYWEQSGTKVYNDNSTQVAVGILPTGVTRKFTIRTTSPMRIIGYESSNLSMSSDQASAFGAASLKECGHFLPANFTYGGMGIVGYSTHTAASTTAFILGGYVENNPTSLGVFYYNCFKHDGSGGLTKVGDDGILFGMQNNNAAKFRIYGDGTTRIPLDNVGFQVGGAGDGEVRYNGTNLIIDSKVVGTGKTIFPGGVQISGIIENTGISGYINSVSGVLRTDITNLNSAVATDNLKLNDYVVMKSVSKTAIASGVATEVFKITTTDESGNNDGGGYSVFVNATVLHAGSEDSTPSASKSYIGNYTHINQADGGGGNSNVTPISLSAVAANNAAQRSIDTVVMSASTISTTESRVSFNIALTGTSVTTANVAAFVQLTYWGYLHAPVIASM